MLKKFFILITAMFLVVGLSGCITSKKTVSVGSLSGVFVSQDNGAKWTAKNQLMTPGNTPGNINTLNVIGMYYDPSDPNALYLATRDSGVYYTYNGAEGWNKAAAFSSSERGKVYSLAVDPQDKCTIYAGVNNKIYFSEDCARSWKAIFNTDNATEIIRALIVDWVDNNIVWALAADGSLYKSSTRGKNWARVYDFGVDSIDFDMDPHDNRIMYVVTDGSWIYKTVDAGVTWVNLKDQLKSFDSSVKKGVGLEIAKDKPDTIYYLSKFGMLKSADGGATWEQINLLTREGEKVFYAFAVDPFNSQNLYYADEKTFYRSFDEGKTWETIKLPSTQRVSEIRVRNKAKENNIIYMSFKQVESKK